ncbi:uncharacterized protein ATNIH1004_003847 [Aspergillus tanneri]|nr:uncharacterized protein ATNIH1004_003847 [Aspergillus tanneri]KAA8647965.1 hypothetical protein ATNIH1004_003847 [Aspergillus tanneri]
MGSSHPGCRPHLKDQSIRSATTLKLQTTSEFGSKRAQLKELLGNQCDTIALSLGARTSTNHLPILAIIGHWLAPDLTYQGRTRKVENFMVWLYTRTPFITVHTIKNSGEHSGENLADIVIVTTLNNLTI